MSETSNAMTVAKPRRGRKPARESRADELFDAMIAWKLMPPDKREPRTLTEWADKHGIKKSLAHYYAAKAPDSIEEFIELAEREALARYPRVLKALTDQAEQGSIEAGKVFLREVVGPRRPQKPGFDFKQDVRLQVALQTLFPPLPNSTAPAPPTDGHAATPEPVPALSDATDESSNCPNPSNCADDGESTTSPALVESQRAQATVGRFRRTSQEQRKAMAEKSVVLKLTGEQKVAIKQATGKDIGELWLDASGLDAGQAIEDRKTPMTPTPDLALWVVIRGVVGA